MPGARRDKAGEFPWREAAEGLCVPGASALCKQRPGSRTPGATGCLPMGDSRELGPCSDPRQSNLGKARHLGSSGYGAARGKGDSRREPVLAQEGEVTPGGEDRLKSWGHPLTQQFSIQGHRDSLTGCCSTNNKNSGTDIGFNLKIRKAKRPGH